MPPGTRRANRAGYAEHDDFEGLPVRQWRQEWVNVAPPIEQEPQQVNDVWAMELIHGMPKDFGLLTPHSQELLRAARSGRLYKRSVPTDDDENEVDMTANDKTDKKDDEAAAAPKGFSVKVWKQVPKNVEAPSISHLAKRRKNTVTVASRTVEEKVPGSTVTRATVRRLDAAGNPYTEEVTLVDDGQPVEGEIISTRVETLHAPANPPSLMSAQTAARRRPPPPKRKTKAGPGRGKKKNRGGIAGGPVHAIVRNGPGVAMPSQTERMTEKNATAENSGGNKQNGEMGDGDDDDDDDVGDDGDDDDDDDDDEHGDSDQPDMSISGTAIADTSIADTSIADTSIADASNVDVTMAEDPKDTDENMSDAPTMPAEAKDMVVAADAAAVEKLSPPNPLALTLAPTLSSLATGSSPKVEGSPLKNVVLPSPTTTTEAAAKEPSGASEEMAAATAAKDFGQAMDVDATSTVAEPPSTIVGDEPELATRRDVELPAPTCFGGALLPPPPEQVGNIATTPRADDGSERVSSASSSSSSAAAASDMEDKKKKKKKQDGGLVGGDDKSCGSLQGLDSMAENPIKPEDSASVRFPLTGSAGPSSEADIIDGDDDGGDGGGDGGDGGGGDGDGTVVGKQISGQQGLLLGSGAGRLGEAAAGLVATRVALDERPDGAEMEVEVEEVEEVEVEVEGRADGRERIKEEETLVEEQQQQQQRRTPTGVETATESASQDKGEREFGVGSGRALLESVADTDADTAGAGRMEGVKDSVRERLGDALEGSGRGEGRGGDGNGAG